MILMMPTPSTTGEIRATASKRLTLNGDVDGCAGVIFARSRTLKSSSWAMRMSYRSRRRYGLYQDVRPRETAVFSRSGEARRASP
jgi:hypothetical protein